jgi:DNA-binding LacI/PurR family transcriptional regulator
MTLGLVTFGATLYGPASAVDAIEAAADDAGYTTIIVAAQRLDRESVLNAVGRLRDQNVAGIFFIAPLASPSSPLLEISPELPIVAVEATPPGRLTAIGVNQELGAARATRHLLDLGHPTVQHISGPADWLATRQRIDGWRSALEHAGAVVPEPLLGDWSSRSGYEIGQRLATRQDVSAIFAANDQMALGVLRALRESGRDVPRQVSVIGFDDIPEAQYFAPPLTSVRQDFNEVGRRGVQLLLSRIDQIGRPVEKILLEPDLVVRESTARYSVP